jgi:hypothetical protein
MSDIISIKNKLEIKLGEVVQVPGCEPLTSISSLELSKNMNCNASVIPVKDVLRLIPGSRMVRAFYPAGQSGTGRFIELPNGPPHDGNKCPQDCLEDWYRILRENARVPETEGSEADQACASIRDWSGCVNDYDPTQHPRADDHRPNVLPL